MNFFLEQSSASKSAAFGNTSVHGVSHDAAVFAHLPLLVPAACAATVDAGPHYSLS